VGFLRGLRCSTRRITTMANKKHTCKIKPRIDGYAKDALKEIDKADKALRKRDVLSLDLAKIKKDLLKITGDHHVQ
jgi:hypothetical protein